MKTFVPNLTLNLFPWNISASPTEVRCPSLDRQATQTPSLFAFATDAQKDSQDLEDWRDARNSTLRGTIIPVLSDKSQLPETVKLTMNYTVMYSMPTFPINLRTAQEATHSVRRENVSTNKSVQDWSIEKLVSPDFNYQTRRYTTEGRLTSLKFLNLQPFADFHFVFSFKVTAPLKTWIDPANNQWKPLPIFQEDVTFGSESTVMLYMRYQKGQDIYTSPDLPNVYADSRLCTGSMPGITAMIRQAQGQIIPGATFWMKRYFAQSSNADLCTSETREFLNSLREVGGQTLVSDRAHIRTWSQSNTTSGEPLPGVVLPDLEGL